MTAIEIHNALARKMIVACIESIAPHRPLDMLDIMISAPLTHNDERDDDPLMNRLYLVHCLGLPLMQVHVNLMKSERWADIAIHRDHNQTLRFICKDVGGELVVELKK